MTRLARRPALMLAMACLLSGLGADREVRKIHVPAGKVGTFFPDGTDLKVLPLDRFEELLRAARARPDGPRPPRIVRASHAVTWNSGVILGRSEFFVDREPNSPTALIVLDPWSPAIVGVGPARATEDGRLAIVVDEGSPLPLDWRLRARTGSEGRAFALSLPEIEVSGLTLDLPQGLIPEGDWDGPKPGSADDRRSWRLDAARGQVDLRLRPQANGEPSVDASKRWLQGPTRIDLAGSTANWKADWSVEDLPGASSRLTVDLDPDLDLLDVEGPRVRSFRVESRPRGERVSILLDDQGQGASALTIRALCRPPTEGLWSVPSARPVDATWTGGRMSIRLDSSRVLQSCTDRSGRRVGPGAGDPSQPSALIFEPTGLAGPVADLTFRKPSADASVDVHGHLRLDDDAPRIAVDLTWTVDRGRLLSYSADLPPGWSTDRVITPAGLPVSWHAETLSSGESRVYMNPSPVVEESRTLTLILEASNRQAGTRGPIDLPRVRPSTPGLRIADEVWLATSKSDLDVRPILERGLAWLDPVEKGPGSSADLRRALAWRWLAEDAEGRVDRSTVRSSIRGDVRLDAQVVADRLHLDWTIVIEPSGQAVRSIPIHLDEPSDHSIRWRVVEPSGLILEARPLSDPLRVAQGFPSTGSAWNLELASLVRGRVEIKGHADRPWSGSGPIPILGLPTRYESRGLVAVNVPETSRSNLKAIGLTAVDLSQSSTPGDDPAKESQPRVRRAGMFAYRGIGGQLALETIAGQPGPSGGVVREAFLNTQAFPGSGFKHRLTLRVVVVDARSVTLTMPPGVVIDRLRRDGQTVSARGIDGRLEIPIPAPTLNRRSCVVTIEFRTDEGLKRSTIALDSILPSCSMPSLSFSWEVSAPEPWDIGETSDGLVSADPRPAVSWADRLLGFPFWDWSRGERRSADRGAILLELDRTIAGTMSEETTFGEMLLRLDAGRWPVVVDRLAIHGAGWGPMSRLGSVVGDSRSNPTASSILHALGLVAVPFDGLILISTRAETPLARIELETWQATLSRAATTGSDPADRFQSVARWRGEATPRAQAAGDPIDRSPSASGWKTHHLTAAGWPELGASIRLVDERSMTVNGWIVAAMVVLAGVLARWLPARVRAIGIAVVAIAASGSLAWSGAEPSPVAIGLIRGGIVVLFLWLLRSRRPILPGPVSESDATTVTRRTRHPARSATLGMILVAIGIHAVASADGHPREGPIVVLIPYEGTFDPQAPAKNVVMRLDDFDALERQARGDVNPPRSRPTLKSVVHDIGRDEPGTATVASRFEVVADESSSWTVPIGSARDLVGTVDGQAVPVPVSADGASASIPISVPGPHIVTFRRIVPLRVQPGGAERFRLPINRSAFARVTVSKRDPAERVEVAGAMVSGVEAELGPVTDLDVTWLPTDERVDTLSAKKPVEAAILWDARPSGDLVRARFRHSNPDGIAMFRLAVEPGVVVRSFHLPGLVAAGWDSPTEWVARVDPPIAAGEPISVDLWRPACAGLVDRSLPGFEVVGLGRLSGVIAFRRGVDWTGRLDPRGTLESSTNQAFERAWGPMPDDGLTLAGVARFVDAPSCRVPTGPLVSKRSARTTVGLELKPGRLDATIDVVLEDQQGRSFDLEIGLPIDFRIVRVEATGLVDWQRATRGRLRLQFDGTEVRQRSIQVRGYLAVPADTLLGDHRAFQAKVPWPSLSGVEATSGSLIIGAPDRFQMEAGDGVVATSLPGKLENFHATYQVDRPEGLGPIRWTSPPARVVVAVRSHLTVDPNQVTWMSIVDCEVSGGPAESLNWRLPASWAKDATLEVDGVPVKPVSEIKESFAYWTITPASPIWGRSRLVLTSTQPILRADFFDYPEVAPRSSAGRGAVLSYDLTIANLSGRSIEFAGSPGLQAVDTAPFQSGESGPVDRAYHVSGEKWNLRLRIGPVEAGPVGQDHLARVTNSQLSVVLGADGQTRGRARYRLEDRPATFLELSLPPEADVPWASVDGLAATTVRQGAGRWLIPLGGREAKRVQILWKQGAMAGPSRLAIPDIGRESVPTMISVTTPRSVQVESPGARLRRVDQAGWELGIAEEEARRIVRSLSDLDRASSRDREAVVDEIVDFELRVRTVERLGSTASAKATADRIQAARLMIDDSGQVAGLDDLIAEARSLVGIAAPPVDREVGAVESAEALRIRRVGETRYFDGSRGEGAIGLTWQVTPDRPRWARLDVGIVGLGGLVASVGVWFFGRSRIG